jgi:hypothetical protein
MIVIVFILAVVVSMPIAAVVLVSIASRREDSAWSLAEAPRGAGQAAARRILDFHTEKTSLPVSKERELAARPVVTVAPSRTRVVLGANDIDAARPLVTTKMSVRPAA